MRTTHGKPERTCEAGASCGQGGFDFEADRGNQTPVEQASATATLDQQDDCGCVELVAPERQTLVCCRNCQHAEWDKWQAHIDVGFVACKLSPVTGYFKPYDRPHVCATYDEAMP